ncbi:MAG: 6-pyruvoyl trahydropterin synthase family protein [Myxococcales bacterium]
MFQVTQELAFCYGHRLLGYPGKCGRLHGHNARAFVTLRADALDAQGMVADFDLIQGRVRAYVDEQLDHQLLLHRDDPLVPALRSVGEPFRALDVPPTAENLARILFEQAERAGLPVAEVRLEEQPGSVATFRK